MRIMVVDDEPLTRQFLTVNIPLLHEGCEVVAEAMDGREALDLLPDHPVELIITDIKMPVMDGLALCAQLNEFYPKVKMVILSGFDDFSFAKQAIHYGVNEYLLKPIDRDELIDVLQRMVGQVAAEQAAESARQVVNHLSEETKQQVVRHFIKAAVMDNNAEIQALYPLLYRMRIGLIEPEAAIMLIALDEQSLLDKSMSRPDLSLFRYIVNQVTAELAEQDNLGIVSFDAEDNTIVLVGGESEREIMDRCDHLHRGLSDILMRTSGITVTSAVGGLVQDALQLHVSYQQARDACDWRLTGGGAALYRYEPYSPLAKASRIALESINSIQTAVRDQSEMTSSLLVRTYMDSLDLSNKISDAAAAFGILLIRKLESFAGTSSAAISEAAFDRLRELVRSDYPSSNENEQTAAALNEIVRLFGAARDTGQSDENEIAARAKAYIHGHYAEPISLGQLADYLGVTATYLSSLFHKSIGESYIKYLTRVRMEKAAILLKSSAELKVYDIADKVGYVSDKHFSHVFKQHYGMPPGEYQENHRRHLP